MVEVQPFAGKQDGLVARNLANPSGQPIPDSLTARLRCRPPAQRVPAPKVGDRVRYRHHAHGPTSEAEVRHVVWNNKEDYGVWRFVLDETSPSRRPVEVNGERVMELVEDPWVDVYLMTQYGYLATREARAPGSAGWLPLEGE